MYSSQSGQLARVSLAKFSHTTTSNNHNGPLNWSHIFGNGDMSAILERQVASRVLLKVFQSHELLEEVDLTYHTQEAARQAEKQIKPTFAVIVKSPCLAVKYPKGGNCRRFQVKFSSDRDYYTILAILSGINCPFSESNVTSQPARRSTQWRTAEAYIPSLSSGFNDVNQSITSRPVSSTTHTDLTTTHIQPDIQPDQPVPVPEKSSMAYHDPQTLNQILPPKRDLPFTKPAAKRPRKDTDPHPNILTPNPTQGPRRSLTAFPQGISQPGISPVITPRPSQSTPGPGPGPGPGPSLLPRHESTTPGPNLVTDLHAYASSPTETRTARLETWLCEHIQDDDFLRLCQDVEGVWKRVAFGGES